MSKRIDLTGRRFGKLIAKEYIYSKDSGYWFCVCDCGGIGYFLSQELQRGSKYDCGCGKKLIGKKFGKLLVIKDPEVAGKFSECRCVCDCGGELFVKRNNLITGNTNSCGCIRIGKPNSLRHGKYGTKIYKTWRGIKNRCNNKNEKMYKLYGGRGIQCLRKSFEEFEKDMSEGCKEGLSIDRIDVNGNYCKENCRRATPKEQANNRRTNKFITLDGVSLTEKQREEKLGFNRGIIGYRLGKGWSIKKTLLTKSRKGN